MKIWFFYAGVGAGHYAPAKAVANELEQSYGSAVKVELFNVLNFMPSWVKLVIEGGYMFMSNRIPWLYAFIFSGSKFLPLLWLENWLLKVLGQKKLTKKLVAERPDKIVCFIYMGAPIVVALKKLKLNTPLLYVCTDTYTTHPFWFLYPEYQFVVFSEQVKKQALRKWVPESHIKVVPQVISNKFNKVAGKDVKEIKISLDFNPNRKIVLLAGGGNGLPKVDKVLGELIKQKLGVDYVVVCGNNKKQQKDVKKLIRGLNGNSSGVVYGFVDNMQELMAASSLIITKAGASGIFEALFLKKPLLITHYIWGQERGNKDFVQREQVGFYEPNSVRAAKKAKQMLFNDQVKTSLKNNIDKLNFRSGTKELADYIYSLNL